MVVSFKHSSFLLTTPANQSTKISTFLLTCQTTLWIRISPDPQSLVFTHSSNHKDRPNLGEQRRSPLSFANHKDILNTGKSNGARKANPKVFGKDMISVPSYQHMSLNKQIMCSNGECSGQSTIVKYCPCWNRRQSIRTVNKLKNIYVLTTLEKFSTQIFPNKSTRDRGQNQSSSRGSLKLLQLWSTIQQDPTQITNNDRNSYSQFNKP